MDWPLVEGNIASWRQLQEELTMMDTDALLLPTKNAKGPIEGWQDVVKANTEALKEIRLDLDTCNNVDKVRALMTKVEQAMSDLAVDSQKIPQWMKDAKDAVPPPTHYGQYPVNQPLNRDNPVPWPPGYTPEGQVQSQEQAIHAAKGAKQ